MDAAAAEAPERKKRAGGRKPTTVSKKARHLATARGEYYFEGGLRKVRPYFFEYFTYAKERWVGKSIIDVFKREFRDRPPAYYAACIRDDLIRVNGEACSLDLVIENGDLVSHRLHRHEPPVTAEPVKILFDDGAMVVVNKPASIPAHPSGRYRFNSLIEILKADHGFGHLSLINRLDRLTSGICILARDAATAERLHLLMEGRAYFRKEYVARVLGVFPGGGAEVTCEEPLDCANHKLGAVIVDRANGKESKTTFSLLSTDGVHSVVRCVPLTGRTHQIRVHLLSLGHPIVNDVLYNNEHWAAAALSPTPTKEAIERISQTLLHHVKSADDLVQFGGAPEDDTGDTAACPDCVRPLADPKEDQLCIYLHACKYSSPDWSFEAPWPSWTALGAPTAPPKEEGSSDGGEQREAA